MTNVPEGEGRGRQNVPTRGLQFCKLERALCLQRAKEGVGWRRKVGPFQVSRSWPTPPLRTETAWGKSQGTWITQELEDLPERAKDQLPSGKQQKGRNGDKRQEEEPLCLMGPGYVKSGLHTPQFPGRCFSQGWVYEKRTGQSSHQGQSRCF